MTARSVRSSFAVAALTCGIVFAGAPAASAACATYPGTNEIVIKVGSGDPLMSIAPTPSGLVGVCVDVIGEPNPSVDPDVTVEVYPQGCGTPCFVLAWDGVSTGPVTVRVTVTVDKTTTTVERVVGGQGDGSFCINAGTPCP